MFHRKRDARGTNGDDTSLIASGTVIRGDVYFAGTLHLDGCVEGAVLATSDEATLTLSEHAKVDGEIRVPHAVINGHVTGNVTISARLQLAPLARIDGDLCYHTLEMAAGARVNGRIAQQSEAAPRELAAPLPAADETADETIDDAVVV